MKKNTIMTGLLLSGFITFSVIAQEKLLTHKNELTFYQVMQQIIYHYPTLKITNLSIEQAALQRQQVESGLGWILNSSAGMQHDVTGIGTPSDRLDLNASFARKLKSGATLSLSGAYSYEDSSLVLSNVLPNPVHNTRLDLSYRLPLAQGDGNPLYTEGLVSANANEKSAKAIQIQTLITLSEQAKDLFYAAAMTKAQLINAQQAVVRIRKLKSYINNRFKLGLSETQDKLQVTAQLQTQLAQVSAIQLLWQKQKTALNRLMSEPWDKNFTPALVNSEDYKNVELYPLIKNTEKTHPAVRLAQAKLDIAESNINLASDLKRDNLDLVMSVGTRTADGKNATSNVSEQDWAGSLRIEYKHIFDDKGLSSKHRQARLQKNIALEELQKAKDDIRYTVSSLVAEIKAARQAVASAYRQLKSESLKLKEVEQRYRNGRANTSLVIQFQNEYSVSQLAHRKQKIELNNRLVSLQIFTGKFLNKMDFGFSAGLGANK